MSLSIYIYMCVCVEWYTLGEKPIITQSQGPTLKASLLYNGLFYNDILVIPSQLLTINLGDNNSRRLVLLGVVV